MKISILLTAWKEEKTIGKAIETFIGNYTGDFELLLAIPDVETKKAALLKAKELGIEDRVWVSDFAEDGKPKGKPAELNYLMDHATGDVWFFGDGDVWFGDSVIEKMLKHFEDRAVYAVTGRPVSSDSKDSLMGYMGNLLADAAHHKRTIDLSNINTGKAATFVKKRPFFPVSGYLFAMRKTDIRAPKDTLVEDAFFSYEVFNRGYKIAYEPEAIVYVSYPKNLKDYFKQKKRSVGGYVQLWNYGVVKDSTKTRSFWRELEYFWFPLTYAKGFKQFVWSLLMYPIRLWLWIVIFWERKIQNKDFTKTWVRVESTK
jgi:biofilm PGA synthesis N-glycosyltransferase PgaC